MKNTIKLQNGIYYFTGVATPPELDCVAIELAREWQNGGTDLEILRLHGLPNGRSEQPVAEVDAFLTDIHTGVSLLSAAGVFRASPSIEALGFTSESKNPPEDFIRMISGQQQSAQRGVAYSGGAFICRTVTNHNLSAWAYEGLSDIALANGSKLYGICAMPRCNRVFVRNTAKAVYCCDAHRVRAAQLRKEAA